MSRIHIAVKTRGYDGEPLTDLRLTWEMTMQNKKVHDQFKNLIGDGYGKVSVSLSEKIDGPGYSNTTVYVSVSLACDQSKGGIEAALGAAHDEAFAFLDAHIDEAVHRLHHHLQRLGDGEGG